MNVGVYGLGRFGAFWAELLAKHFPVTAWSRNPDRPVPPGVRRVSLPELFEADIVWLCPAISSMDEVLTEIAPLVRPGHTIADTCSVKIVPAQLMERHLPAGVGLLATHPMFGPDSAKAGLEGLPVVLHDLRDAAEPLEFWAKTFSGLGMNVLRLTPEEHDEAAAYTQGVTHFLGRVLDDMGLKGHPIATRGYQRLLDLVQQTCNDPFQLFLDMQNYNPHTAAMRADLKASLERISSRLDTPPTPR
jgi:prephenate dehydrogenase